MVECPEFKPEKRGPTSDRDVGQGRKHEWRGGDETNTTKELKDGIVEAGDQINRVYQTKVLDRNNDFGGGPRRSETLWKTS